MSYTPVVEQIRSADLNGWTSIQHVSHSLVFEQIRTPDGNGWTQIQHVSHTSVSKPLMRMPQWLILYSGCNLLSLPDYRVALSCWLGLTFIQANALAVFLNARFNSGLSSITSCFSFKQKSSLISFTGLFNAFLPVWIFIHFLSWCQLEQHFSSAWKIPSGMSVKMEVLWNCLNNLSRYMLRVEQTRSWRQPSIYWEMARSKVDILGLISRQSFICLLLNIFSVSFIVSLYLTHLTIFFT